MPTTVFSAVCFLAQRNRSAAWSVSPFETFSIASTFARQVSAKLIEAKSRRRTLTDLSSAVNFYSRDRGGARRGAEALFRQFDSSQRTCERARGSAPAGHKIAGFEVGTKKGLTDGDVQIDFSLRKVLFDFESDAWSTTVYLNGQYYEVSLRQGKADQPICEFDNTREADLCELGPSGQAAHG